MLSLSRGSRYTSLKTIGITLAFFTLVIAIPWGISESRSCQEGYRKDEQGNCQKGHTGPKMNDDDFDDNEDTPKPSNQETTSVHGPAVNEPQQETETTEGTQDFRQKDTSYGTGSITKDKQLSAQEPHDEPSTKDGSTVPELNQRILVFIVGFFTAIAMLLAVRKVVVFWRRLRSVISS